MLMEVMGLHLPGAAFVHPNTPLREALTAAAARRVLEISARGNQYTPIAEVVDERAVINGIVALMATGGSTNHTIHLVAMARAAGIQITWNDFDAISAVTPLLARIYPNGRADVNHFHAAGGMAFLIGELLDAGLLHEDVTTVAGRGLSAYRQEPALEHGALVWKDGAVRSGDPSVLGALQDQGFHVGLVTDGRMSGASGKVPMVIHLSPEVMMGGTVGRERDGDVITLDAEAGTLVAEVAEAEWEARDVAIGGHDPLSETLGREAADRNAPVPRGRADSCRRDTP